MSFEIRQALLGGFWDLGGWQEFVSDIMPSARGYVAWDRMRVVWK